VLHVALQQKPKENKRILPFVTQYQPAAPNLKQILMKNCHLIEQQPLIQRPPLISYKRYTRESQTMNKKAKTRARESLIVHCGTA